VTVAFDTGAELGEGALWDWRDDLLLSVDIPAGRVLGSDPRDGSTRSFDVGQPVSAAMLRGEHELLLAVRDGFATSKRAPWSRSWPWRRTTRPTA
jgi:sugar lactone lactonase YvrE